MRRLFGLILFAMPFCLRGAPPLVIPQLSQAPPAQWKTQGLPPAALSLRDFRQREPRDGQPGTDATEAQIARDSQAIYVFVRAAAKPGTVRANMSPRDQLGGDDAIGLYLDTLHDQQRAYVFFVNPMGVQLDGIASERQEDDYSFDAVWESGGRLTANGYEVWLRIPLQSIRYASGETAQWGVALTRYTAARNEVATYPYLSRGLQGFIPQFATAAAPGRGGSLHSYRFIPYVSYRHDGQGQETRGGLDAQWNVGDRISIDGTFRPDFSQVEADAPQLSRNRRFENFYPERRPFFMEHADFFNTAETAFFSRRVQSPEAGVRMTGSAGGFKFGWLGVDDRREEGPNAHLSVGRVRYDFGQKASVGAVYTDLREQGVSRMMSGVDGSVRLNDQWSATGQWLHSNNANSAAYAEMRYQGRNVHSATSYRYRGREFDAALGYMPRVNLQQTRQVSGYRFRPATGPLLGWGPDVEAETIRDTAGTLTDWSVAVPLLFEFRGQRELRVSREESLEVYRGVALRKHRMSATYSDDHWRSFGWGAAYHRGDEFNYYPVEGRRPEGGQLVSWTGRATVRPSRSMRVDGAWIERRLADKATQIYAERLWRIQLTRQFSKPLSVRVILDGNHATANPMRVDWEGSNRLLKDVLVRYQLNPWTAAYVGYSEYTFPRRDRIVYCKLSYLIH
jgi:predicted porin